MVLLRQDEILRYEELLRLLEEKYENKEIDKNSYVELRERYIEKIAYLKKEQELLKETSLTNITGLKSLTEDSFTISGSAKINGGKFKQDIRISGATKFNKDLECRNFLSSGMVKISGNLVVRENIRSSGLLKCEGGLHVGENAFFSGTSLVLKEITIEGFLSVSGTFKCNENVQATKGMSLSGSSKILGSLYSKNTIKISGKCNIKKDIICENLFVEGRRTIFEAWLSRKKKKLVQIYGNVYLKNEVDIQDTHVHKDIKGRIVKLGPNTKVSGKVYFVEELLVSDKVKLENEPVKITIKEL
ncbi:MAG: hypothetical protein ACTSX6_02050 [Candidatus Heimdallarchaeaceae archaeon]